MQSEDIKHLIEAEVTGSQAFVTGDGYKFEAVVVSPAFEGLTMLKEQQLVYAALNEQIASGALHALTIKAYTPAEWRILNER
jgi:acid stress-induced BolA-like protein IbaG/YrbA